MASLAFRAAKQPQLTPVPEDLQSEPAPVGPRGGAFLYFALSSILFGFLPCCHFHSPLFGFNDNKASLSKHFYRILKLFYATIRFYTTSQILIMGSRVILGTGLNSTHQFKAVLSFCSKRSFIGCCRQIWIKKDVKALLT